VKDLSLMTEEKRKDTRTHRNPRGHWKHFAVTLNTKKKGKLCLCTEEEKWKSGGGNIPLRMVFCGGKNKRGRRKKRSPSPLLLGGKKKIATRDNTDVRTWEGKAGSFSRPFCFFSPFANQIKRKYQQLKVHTCPLGRGTTARNSLLKAGVTRERHVSRVSTQIGVNWKEGQRPSLIPLPKSC